MTRFIMDSLSNDPKKEPLIHMSRAFARRMEKNRHFRRLFTTHVSM